MIGLLYIDITLDKLSWWPDLREVSLLQLDPSPELIHGHDPQVGPVLLGKLDQLFIVKLLLKIET